MKSAAQLFSRLPLVTADASSIEALLLLLNPFLQSLFCEVAAIVGFGMGIGHQRKVASAGKVSTLSTPTKPFPEQENVGRKVSKGLKERFPQASDVTMVLERVGRPVSNVELAQLLGCSEGESSKRVSEMNGSISRVKIGRCVSISLKRRA